MYFLAAGMCQKMGRDEEGAAASPRGAQHCPQLPRAAAWAEVPIPSPDKITFVPPVICFLTNARQKPPQPGEKEQLKDTALTGQPVHASRSSWHPEPRRSRHGP